MGRKYFGTDGIRGRVGEMPIVPDFVMRLGYAAGKVLARAEAGAERPAVLIGKDTRISGYMLESALEAGFAAAGVDTLLCGPMPTPAVAYLTRALRLKAGIVISASHNPYDDNGIKFFSAGGVKLPDEVELAIETEMEQPLGCMASANLGRARRVSDAAGRYIEFCKSTFPNDLDLRGMRIVVDCAHGATYQVAPHVFHELGADVIAYGAQPDGLNINREVGATHPSTLARVVRDNRADVGIALDGDGDRLVMADADGAIYDGDQLLYVVAQHRVRNGGLTGLVGTLMTNLALEHAMAAMNVAFARAAVGDRYVLETMIEQGWQLGGENSGHIICLDKHSTGDGIVSALQVLTAIRTQNASLKQLASGLRLYPQSLINVRMPKGFPWKEHDGIAQARQRCEAHLGNTGRVLLRASGTEPVLRVMVEGEDEERVVGLAQSLAQTIEQVMKAAGAN